jgi:hypothetical protein
MTIAPRFAKHTARRNPVSPSSELGERKTKTKVGAAFGVLRAIARAVTRCGPMATDGGAKRLLLVSAFRAASSVESFGERGSYSRKAAGNT